MKKILERIVVAAGLVIVFAGCGSPWVRDILSKPEEQQEELNKPEESKEPVMVLYVASASVTPAGNDITGDGSADAPFATVDRALAAIQAGYNVNWPNYQQGANPALPPDPARILIKGTITDGGTSSGLVEIYDYSLYATYPPIILTGNGTGTLDGSLTRGVLSIQNMDVTLEAGLTLTRGNAYAGGGVYVDGGSFTMSGGTISGNTADNGGGGVYVSNGAFTMSGGTISGNIADNGGGVYVASGGSFSKTGGTIYGDTDAIHTMGADENTATSGASGSGHAVYVVSGSKYRDSTAGPGDNIDTAESMGLNSSGPTYTVTFDLNGGTGAIPAEQYVEGNDGTGTIAEPGSRPRSTVAGEVFAGWYTDNVLYTTQWDFAAMTLSAITDGVDHTMTLYAKWETDPYAADDFGSTALIEDIFTVTDKPAWNAALAAISGGGNNKNYVINLTTSFSIDGLASGVWSFGSVTGVTVSLRGVHTISLDSGSTGSLLRIGNQTLILRDLTLKGHITNDTSLVYVGGSLSMKAGATITGNTADYGGGVRVGSSGDSGSFTMEGGVISGNSASSGLGGGVLVQYGTFTMYDGEISDNISGSNGGGVFVGVSGSSSFTMEGGVISGNFASSGGGGVSVSFDSSFTMNDGEISGNTSDGGGGGVYASGNFIMKDGEISGNSATSIVGGGGVFVSSSSFTMEGGVISGNTAGSYGGGGVFVSNSSSFSKTGNSVIYGDTDTTNTPPENTAASGNTNGHAVYYNDGSFYYYRDTTLNAGDNINTSTVPSSGTGNNWTKK